MQHRSLSASKSTTQTPVPTYVAVFLTVLIFGLAGWYVWSKNY